LRFVQSWLYLQRAKAKVERKYVKAAIRIYADTADVTARAFKKYQNPDNLYNVIFKHLRKFLEPLLIRLYQDAANEAGPLISLFTSYEQKASSQSPWSLRGFARVFTDKAQEIVAKMSLSLHVRIKQMITAAIIAKLSVDQIALKIKEFFGFSTVRAQQMVQTQIHSAAMAGQYEVAAISYNRNQTTKTWVDTGDDRVRPTHVEAGKTQREVPFDAPFIIGGHFCQYPGDPSLPYEELVNCRCSMRLTISIL
jgi:hypothetical protein